MNVEIREATLQDVPAIVAMAERFVAETDYRGFIALDPGRIAHIAEQLIAHPDGAIFVAARDGEPSGMFAVHLFSHPMSGERAAQEIVWWMEPEHRRDGVRLLRRAETWAREHGAALMQMVAPNARVGEFYSAVGYRPVETAYMRRLS